MSAPARWLASLLVLAALAGAAAETGARDPTRDDVALAHALDRVPSDRLRTAVSWMEGYGSVERIYAAQATTKGNWRRREPSNTSASSIGPHNASEPVYAFLFLGNFEDVGPVMAGRGPSVARYGAGRLVLLESGPPVLVELTDGPYPVPPWRAFDPAFDDR